MKRITRRNFMKRTAAVGAGLADFALAGFGVFGRTFPRSKLL